jgi:hypothetical protein
MRGNPDYSTNKDYVLGGHYNTTMDHDGSFSVEMRLTVRLNKIADFGIYKCIAKNALGSSEDSIKILRKFFFLISEEKIHQLIN